MVSPGSAAVDFVHDYQELSLPSPRLGEILRDLQPTVVVHCAGRASVPRSLVEPLDDFHANTVVVVDLLDLIRRQSPSSKFVLLSSAAVYGDPTGLPIGEDAVVRPISPYGFHKRQAELACEEYHGVHGLKTVSQRIFSAYGPGLARQVVWDLMRKCEQDDEIVLAGTGAESRDFIHAADVAAATLRVAESEVHHGDVVNVASGEETRIADLAAAIMAAMGVDKPVRFTGEEAAGMPSRWRADISRLTALGFSPRWSLLDGIRDCVAWARPLVRRV
jgi:UDP-glucose 4-epimerase